ncbi:MAG: OmpW family outer membrane protein [Aestuariivita sp.]|uniref:OmpW/AlkL family protein n=1 Tax=Aestuariivita sp. TaxID=1872407 RepID=UPI003BB1491A
MTTQKFALAAATTALCLLAAPTLAQSQGDWTIGIGIGNVNPKSNNGTLAGGAATINDDTQLTLTAEYFFWDNIGIELLAASPFKHDVSINGAYAGTIKHLPPTLSVNYHFPTNGMIKPFAGIGLNYTTFFDETSPLGVLSLKDSFGVAVQLGADFAVSDQGAVRVNVRWMDIDSDVSLNGAPIGTAEIDPIVLGIAYVHRF